MKKGENAIFPLLKDSLSECKYNLKMHRSLKKTHLLWFAMEWNSHQFSRKHFLLYKGEYWFRGGLSILTIRASPQRDIHIPFCGQTSMTFVVTSFGKMEKGSWFFPHKKATTPTIASSSFQFTCYSSWPCWIHQADNLITLVTWSWVSQFCLEWAPSLQPFLCYLLISFVMLFRSPMCWYKKEKLFFFLSKFITFSFLKPEEQIWKFLICNDISFCVLEYPQAWVWIRSVPYEAAVDSPQVYLSWKSEVSSCESNQIMEHTSCQRGERKRIN